MPDYCKDGNFDKLISNPTKKRRQREFLVKEILQKKKSDEDHKWDHLMCMPERFQKYALQKEIRMEHYKNKSLPSFKPTINPKLKKRMNNINNIRPVKSNKNDIKQRRDSFKRKNHTEKLNIQMKVYSVPKITKSQVNQFSKKESQIQKNDNKENFVKVILTY